MAEINALGFAGSNRLQLTAMALSNALHASFLQASRHSSLPLRRLAFA
jgi:hypothetical protein